MLKMFDTLWGGERGEACVDSYFAPRRSSRLCCTPGNTKSVIVCTIFDNTPIIHGFPFLPTHVHLVPKKTPLPAQPPVKELDEDPPSPVSSAGAEYDLPVPEASEDREGRAAGAGEEGGGEEEDGGGDEDLDDEEKDEEDEDGGDDDDEEAFTMDSEPEEDEVRRTL